MIIVTGAAGFIGSQLMRGLNAQGYTHILAVDDLTQGQKYKNLASATFSDYQDYEDFLIHLTSGQPFEERIEAIFHQGACAVTTEWNGRHMLRNNYEYAKQVLHYAARHRIPCFYASSAAVYGNGQVFKESSSLSAPLNVYGYSKWLLDHYVQQRSPWPMPVVGLRYFNVYGPQETHKGPMASVAFHWMNQLCETGKVKLFAGCNGYGNGEQRRDFISVEDVVKVNLWFLNHPGHSGIFNVGTGQARSFNELAKILIALHGAGKIEYIPFPTALRGTYQSFTQADIAALRNAGYQDHFQSLEAGIRQYYAYYQQPVEVL